MSLPSSGQLSIGDIMTQVGTSNGSLGFLGAETGLAFYDNVAISLFYGYPPEYTLYVSLNYYISSIAFQFEYYNNRSGNNVYVDQTNVNSSLAGNQSGDLFDQLAYVNSAFTQPISVAVYLESAFVYGNYADTDFLDCTSFALFNMPSAAAYISIVISN